MKKMDLEKLMSKINYTFKNKKLLLEALTHSSYVNEHNFPNIKDNERLEFLGDSVMDLITTEYIYKNNLKSNEGELSKIKSQIISETVFSTISRDLNLGNYIFLSNGENMSGGRERNSVLGDVFEAMVGAIYLDSDYATTRDVVLKLLESKINNLDKIEWVSDYKSALQEITQLKYKVTPIYTVLSEIGPDHDKTFEIEVRVEERLYGKGVAKSKKMAEKIAAKQAIEKLNKEH
ncbi:ribonuclease III [Streptobacillus moniliformis]|uniref:Ribonuclease 3 n=1 Tax=Streptobacillus moniliformis (strain ATCC 14647 / DSM 12112 / NCTC 10651 / 9901) TaxID=519441 RepID=D1AY72_STRM9|nr:ribonuclease III [Streptobacillus moniliformis]ACZ01248.1 ribonuclease III [Streptobacillus moniliformis DSM 12112]AVL42394.1 ribonuclease III [Streptobacillus moniliformis]QXW65993.1 ribonuclease III [Streptobacillus moniliformis]SQA13597.1 Ribonuclease 3 [Streptobacillus moniliformis]